MRRTRELKILCPVCRHDSGHGFTDGCLLSEDGMAAICCRTVSGKKAGGAGWVHRLGQQIMAPLKKLPPKPEVTIDFSAELRAWQRESQSPNNRPLFEEFARILGVTPQELRHYGCGLDPARSVLTIPIYNSRKQVIGIQRRYLDGSKRQVKGSRVGLFLPDMLPGPGSFMAICEGFSDTVSAYHLLGNCCLGKLNCSSKNDAIIELVTNLWEPPELLIIADNDEVGLRGATDTALSLCPYTERIRILIPGASDFRKWVQSGATKEQVLETIEKTPYF